MRRFLFVSNKYMKNKVGLKKLSHFNYKTLMACGMYNEVSAMGNIYTLLTPREFCNLLGKLLADGICINVQYRFKDSTIPIIKRLTDAIKSKTPNIPCKIGKGGKGEPLFLCYKGKILFAKNGVVKVSKTIYNFETNLAGRMLTDIVSRYKTLVVKPKRKQRLIIPPNLQQRNANKKAVKPKKG